MAVNLATTTPKYTRTTRLPNPNNFTILAWVMLDTITDSATSYTWQLTDAGSGDLHLYLINNGTTETYGYEDNTQGNVSSAQTTIVANRPFHTAFSSRGVNTTGATNLYLNGTNTFSYKNGSFTPTTLRIGNTTGNITVSDIRIWDRELTPSEINLEKMSNRPVSYAKLNSWYRFDSVSQGVIDSWGGLPLTITGTPTNKPNVQQGWTRTPIGIQPFVVAPGADVLFSASCL